MPSRTRIIPQSNSLENFDPDTRSLPAIIFRDSDLVFQDIFADSSFVIEYFSLKFSQRKFR
jgi:hypothetical protein